MSNSFFDEILREASDHNSSLASLLRKAKILASKLELHDFIEWIDNELNGYDCLSKDLPDYRKINGDPKAYNPYHGWQSIMFQNSKQREAYSFAPIGQGIGSLEKLILEADDNNTGGVFSFQYSPEIKQNIIDALDHPSS